MIARAGQRRLDSEIGRRAGLNEQRARRVHPDHLAVALELPRRHRAAGEATAEAGVAEQVARVPRPAATIEIGGRSRGREALDARPDRHRDHVLFQPFVVADARVAPGRQHIDEAVLGDDLQADLGIGGQEGWDDRGQHQTRGADRDIEPEGSGRPVAKAVHDVEGRFHFAQSWSEPLEQALPSLGRHDAAGRAVQQPDTELCFEPAHGVAEPGGAAAARACSVAETLGAGHRDEGLHIAEIQFHCPSLRTACADCARLS